jgi:hypothetical protein
LGRGTLKCVCIYDDEMQTIIVEIEKEEHEISLTELDKYEFKLVLSGDTTIPLSERIKSSGQSLIYNNIKDAIHGVNISILPEKYVENKDN